MRYRDATARARSAGGCGREVPRAAWQGILAHRETAVRRHTERAARPRGAGRDPVGRRWAGHRRKGLTKVGSDPSYELLPAWGLGPRVGRARRSWARRRPPP